MAAAVIGGSPQSDGFKDDIETLAGDPHLRGVRTVLHDPDRPRGMCLEPRFVDNMKLLGRLGLSFDLCLRPAEIGDGVRLIEKCPGTRFIIDHCGNMDVQAIGSKTWSAWQSGIAAAARHENAVCKISGIVVTAKAGTWKPADLAPVVNHCLDSFGEDRVFFGGDWPVCTLKASYSQWVEALFEIVRDRSPGFKRKLFHDNAVKFYKLDG
jgi:L-fuconolactonase